jgi:hypothetical protein
VLVCAQPEKAPVQADEGFAVIWRKAQRARSELLGIWVSSLWSRGMTACRHAAAMSRLLPCWLTLLAVGMYAPANGQSSGPDQREEQHGIRLPGSNYYLVLDMRQFLPPAGRASEQALLDVIEKWLSSQFDFPNIDEHPRIEFVPSAKIVSLRFSGLLSNPGAEITSDDRGSSVQYDTLALYQDATQTIYLPEGWTGSAAAEVSVLVHEVVHHFQNVLGLKYECPQEREKLAYIAQDRWLAHFGHSLESAFHIDAFSLLVKTRCF